MRRSFIGALVLASLLFTPSLAARTNYIVGDAKKAASTPYNQFTVRLRDVQSAATVSQPLDDRGQFVWNNVPDASYIVELVNREGKVVCTEGPFDLREKPYHAVTIDCGKRVAAWWLLSAASAAGVTAGVVTAPPASPSR